MEKVERFIFYVFILVLPTQLGKHFWPDFSSVSGIRIDYLSPIVYFTDVLLILLFTFFLLRQISLFKISNLKSQKLFYSLSFKFYLPFFIFLFFILNIFFADRLLLSLFGFLKLIECAFLSFYLAKTVRHKIQLQQIAFLFAISSFFESLLAIAQYLHQGSLNGIFYFFGERMFTGDTPGIANADIGGTLILRPYATFPHPNVLAGYLLIAMVLVWSFLLKNTTRWIHSFAVVTLFGSSIALLLTFGRVAILLWALVLVILFIQLLFKKIKTIPQKILFTGLVLFILAILGSLPLSHDVLSRFAQTSLSDESVTERTELLLASLKIMQQHPLFGVGLYNFIPALAPLQKPMPVGLYLQPVHNIFVLVLAETGIIGFGLFIWLLVATLKRIKHYESGIRNTLACLLVIIFVTGMFDHYWLTLQQGQLLFATAIGLSWAKIQKS